MATAERTTAPTPTVMDCIQTIHWLNTNKEDPTPAVATGTAMGRKHHQKTTTWAILKDDVTKAHQRIKLPRMAGASRWHSRTVNGASTRSAPMAWRVPSYIGAGWQQFYSDSAMQSSRALTGGLSLLIIFAGF